MPNKISEVSTWWWSLVKRKPLLMMLFGGLAMILAFPPVPLPWLSWVGFVPILSYLYQQSLEQGKKSWKKRFGIAGRIYLGLLLWNLGTCYWLMLTALSVPTVGEAVEAFTAGFLAVTLNPLIMLLPTLFFYGMLRRTTLFTALVAWIVFWLSFEYLHLNWDLTWSWVTLGHAFTLFPSYIQYIEFTGAHGISLHILVANALIFLALKYAHEFKLPHLTKTGIALASWLILPLALYFFLVESPPFQNKNLVVRVVQPNVDPYQKFNPDQKKEQILNYVRLISEPSKDKDGTIQVSILPETAFPSSIYKMDFMNDDQLFPLYLQAEQNGQDVLSGAVIYEFFKMPGVNNPQATLPKGVVHAIPPVSAGLYDASNGLWYESYNAAFVLGDTTGLFFKKGKLVPFVERVPFMEKMSFLEDFSIDLGGSFGSFGLPDSLHGLRLKHSNAVVAPVICYESQFGDYVRQIVRNSHAGFIAIITNDGWFGESSGHIQHAHMATLRAIENRRWVARSANTGKSLFINPNGEVVQSLGWWKQGYLDQTIELRNEETFYMKYGDYIGRASVFLAALMLVWGYVIRQWILKK